jgi:hypothetical protein
MLHRDMPRSSACAHSPPTLPMNDPTRQLSRSQDLAAKVTRLFQTR